MSRYQEWLRTVFCWDGILPFAIVAIPLLAKLVAPKLEIVHIILIVAVPIAAFFWRVAIGNRHFEEVEHYKWQMVLFAVAIFFLVLVDAVFIIFHMFAQAAAPADWLVLGAMYLIYLLAVGIALFPFRFSNSLNDSRFDLIEEA
jgi:hypothetical protein